MKGYKFVHRTLILMALFAVLAGCSAPKTMRPTYSGVDVKAEQHRQRCLAVEEHRKLNERLYRVSNRVLTGACCLTDKQTDLFGFMIYHKTFFKDDYRDAVAEVYKLGYRPEIVYVDEKTPCALAGLEVGDEVLTIDGFMISDDAKEFKKTLDIASSDSVIVFEVMKDGEKHYIEVKASKKADYPIELVDSNEVNAYADGEKIFITKGLMKLAESDDELAMVISHELAHNLREHIKMSKKNSLVGGFFGILADVGAAALGVNTQGEFTKLGMDAGQGAYSKDIEREADYVGLYLLANSGYDISKGPNLFRRLAASNPNSIEMKYAKTHPSTPERFVMLTETTNEIEDKLTAGIPLVPNEAE